MNRFVNIEHIIGLYFEDCLERNILDFKLSMERLLILVKKVNKESKGYLIRLSSWEIYSLIDRYGNFFCLQDDSIVLSPLFKYRYQKSPEKLLDTFNSYFCAGIPKDIKQGIQKAIGVKLALVK